MRSSTGNGVDSSSSPPAMSRRTQVQPATVRASLMLCCRLTSYQGPRLSSFPKKSSLFATSQFCFDWHSLVSREQSRRSSRAYEDASFVSDFSSASLVWKLRRSRWCLWNATEKENYFMLRGQRCNAFSSGFSARFFLVRKRTRRVGLRGSWDDRLRVWQRSHAKDTFPCVLFVLKPLFIMVDGLSVHSRLSSIGD